MVPPVELQGDDFGAKHMDRGADDFKPPVRHLPKWSPTFLLLTLHPA